MWSIGFSSITGIDKKYLQYSDLKNRELDFDAIPKLKFQQINNIHSPH